MEVGDNRPQDSQRSSSIAASQPAILRDQDQQGVGRYDSALTANKVMAGKTFQRKATRSERTCRCSSCWSLQGRLCF